MQAHKLVVSQVKKITQDATVVTFDIPDALKSTFRFTPGQYLTFSMEKDGEELRRSYSLCTSPNDNLWEVGVKKIAGGTFSVYANDTLKVGDTLTVFPPEGRFGIPSRPSEKRTLIAVAAGSGITPIMSILKFTLQTEASVNFHLFYGNKSPEETMFLEELRALKEMYSEQFHFHPVFSQYGGSGPLDKGRIDPKRLHLFINQIFDINEVDEVMVCGPEELIRSTANVFHQSGIPKSNIHFELFSPADNPIWEGETLNDNIASKNALIEVTLEGDTFEVEALPDQSILDSIEEAGYDPPYSCKGGICSSCVAKIIDGKTEMKENLILTDDEIEKGYILTCQAVPTSSKIKLEYE